MEATIFQIGDVIDYTPAVSRIGGEVVQAAGLAAVCLYDIAANISGAVQIKGVVRVQKVSGAISAGESIGWDEDGNPYLGTVGSGAATINLNNANFLLGKAIYAAASGDTHVLVALNEGFPDEIYVNKNGSDSGDGSALRPYRTIAKAMSVVTATRKTVIVAPGEYEELLGVTWPTISGVKLIGMAAEWMTSISAPITIDQVINVAPGVQTGTWEMWIEKIYIDHAKAGQDGIKLNNTAMAYKMNCYLHNVGGDAASASDKMITVTHGDTSEAVRIYWDGDNGGVEGNVYLETKAAADRLYITEVSLNGGLSTSTDDKASNVRLIRCIVKKEGITGGHASQIATAVCCYSDDDGTFAALASGDFTGDHTPVIVA